MRTRDLRCCGVENSDSDIAAIVTNANQDDVDQGNVAVTRASSDDVRAFASHGGGDASRSRELNSEQLAMTLNLDPLVTKVENQ